MIQKRLHDCRISSGLFSTILPHAAKHLWLWYTSSSALSLGLRAAVHKIRANAQTSASVLVLEGEDKRLITKMEKKNENKRNTSCFFAYMGQCYHVSRSGTTTSCGIKDDASCQF